MKKGLLILLAIILSLIFFFRQDIKELRALSAYSTFFSPENVAETFRTMYKNYDYVTIKAPDKAAPLVYEKNPNPLPYQFTYDDSTYLIKDWINNTQTSGLVIYADGKIQYEQYFNGDAEDTHHLIASCSKSMASTLIGIAVERGLIDLNKLVTDYLPELKGSGYEGATVKQVLQMSTGIKWSEDFGDLNSEVVRSLVAVITGSQDEFAATMVSERKPGSYHHYSTINTHVLGMILRKVTGETYQAFMERELWTKIGAESTAIITTDTKGEPVAYGGIYAVLRDMLRYGILYLNEGTSYQGEQIVSADWVEASVTPDAPRLQPMINNPNSSSWLGYGYQWWLPLNWEGDYSAIGIYGQFIYVFPKYNVVIAKTSAYKDYVNTGFNMEFQTLAAFKEIAKYYGQSAPDISTVEETE